MESIDREKFGGFVARLRKEKGLTQQELADRLFLSNKAVSKWERGQSLPDIEVLEPLAECLGVSVTELLRGERLEDHPLENDEAEALVDRAIQLADHNKKPRMARWRLGWALGAALGFLGMRGMFASGCSRAELTTHVWPVELLCLLFGLWAVFFAPARLPNYYDENRVTAFAQGPVRLNLAGIRIHNGNWPYILAALRWWLVVTPAVYPTVYDYLRRIAAARWTWPWEMWLAVAAILGMFIPVIILAKRYE